MLPAGTVTLLFTDVEGSTRLLDALGPSYAAALAAHREVLRRAVRSQGGHEVDATGDAFLAAFSDAGAALEAAIHAQRELGSGAWSDGISVRVRMGVHTGRPELTGEGYVGRDVHLGARVCDAAHGGQVLVTESTVHAAGSVATKRLGVHRLKDFRERSTSCSTADSRRIFRPSGRGSIVPPAFPNPSPTWWDARRSWRNYAVCCSALHVW